VFLSNFKVSQSNVAVLNSSHSDFVPDHFRFESLWIIRGLTNEGFYVLFLVFGKDNQ